MSMEDDIEGGPSGGSPNLPSTASKPPVKVSSYSSNNNSFLMKVRPYMLSLFGAPASSKGKQPSPKRRSPITYLILLAMITGLVMTVVIFERSMASAETNSWATASHPTMVPTPNTAPSAVVELDHDLNPPVAIVSAQRIASTVTSPPAASPFLRTPYAAYDASRTASILAGMKHTWTGYENVAWGSDEVKPTAGRGNNRWGTMGMTILDSLDVLYLMGMTKEFNHGVEWIEKSLDFKDGSHGGISVFETTIRALGGLISAYEMSQVPSLLASAIDLADGLMPAFQTTSGAAMPHTTLFRGGAGGGMQSTIAEAGTLQLEFGKLSDLTGDMKYRTAADKFHDLLYSKFTHDSNNDRHGMYPMSINVNSGQLSGIISWGASGDSAYEYFLKMYLIGNKKDKRLLDMYNKAVEGLKATLLQKSTSGITYLTDSGAARSAAGGKMEHLACFVPGLLALGALHAPESATAKDDLRVAEELAEACWIMYERTDTGLAAEGVYFTRSGNGANPDFKAIPNMKWNILRPESLESFFVLYQVTGDPKYREWSWKIWLAFEKHCKAPHGYGAHPDVFNANAQCCRGNDDKQETFWIAETIKYAYLTQAEDFGGVDLTKFVLNTEAHPYKLFKE